MAGSLKYIRQFNIFKKRFFKHQLHREFSKIATGENIELDYDYLCDPQNRDEIRFNVKERMCTIDVDKFFHICDQLRDKFCKEEDKTELLKELHKHALLIPNKGSPHLKKYGKTPEVLSYVNEKPTFNFKPKKFKSIVHLLDWISRSKVLSDFTNPKSYYLCKHLADLEQSLIRYSVSILIKNGFKVISVPDILSESVLKGCGIIADNEVHRSVFELKNNEDFCLSGTAEMGIGGYLSNQTFSQEDLPLKFACVSRCFRREHGKSTFESGIFRVNYFTKVEMYGVTANESHEESNSLYKEFVDIQKEIFSKLGLHFQVLDMPLHELALPAYSKTDIEAWIPVERVYKEISSASNCTDYQSRRLNIKYRNSDGDLKFVNTVNGTACAIPRCLIALVTSHQTNKSIKVPEALQPFIRGIKEFYVEKNVNYHQTFNSLVYNGEVVD